jgi:cytochrome c biogenesis protein CcdA/thiol-disulfide isomerase/thioredoxin
MTVLELLLVGVVAGVVAGISPCILPVLPVVLVAGATLPGQGAAVTEPADGARAPVRSRRRLARPVATVLGLVASFSLLILAGSEIISLFHLPSGFLRDAGIVLLVVVGLGFLVEPVARVLERPFARIGSKRQPGGGTGGFVLGLALGALYVPCAGPILAAITVVGATHMVGWTAVFLTVAFGAGTSAPLLIVAVAGTELAARVRVLRTRAPIVRRAGGVILIVMAVAIGLNAFDGLQRDVPGYTSALQSKLEGSQTIRNALGALTGGSHSSLAKCNASATTLVNCGPAPNFKGITAWLNTPGGKPLTIAGLRGKVLLVDFWTYSCINCQRTLPHVEAWYKEYAPYGFVVVGVHTPEFAFEHVVSNVRAEAAQFGVHYPVAVDDNYATWDAYDNEYWPADYLIDAQGDVRHVNFGEGDYSTTEAYIRDLLIAAHPGLVLPPPTDVPDRTPTAALSPETYVGYDRLQYLVSSTGLAKDEPAVYSFPTQLPLGGLAFSGTWDDHSQEATAGPNAKLELAFLAKHVYLVLGGHGAIEASVDNGRARRIVVSGIPRLYTMVSLPATGQGTLLLQVSPGVQAYDFTFG